jgi:collagen type III alpha
MSVMLPYELVWVLNLLGFMWPNVDEDELRAAATQHRQMASQVMAALSVGDHGARAVTSRNAGQSVRAFASRWDRLSAVHLRRLHTVYELIADVQDAMADIVEGAKVAVGAQVTALAAEITAAAAASIVTFGISDAAGLAATAVTRITVREILDALERGLISMAEQLAAGEVLTALSASMASLAGQGVSDYVGTGHGISMAGAASDGLSAGSRGIDELAGHSGVTEAGLGVAVGATGGFSLGSGDA